MKYYAIRYDKMLVFNRTIKGLQKVTSTLANTTGTLKITQVSYVGGRTIGALPYALWTSRGGCPVNNNGCEKITKEVFLKFKPIMIWKKVE